MSPSLVGLLHTWHWLMLEKTVAQFGLVATLCMSQSRFSFVEQNADIPPPSPSSLPAPRSLLRWRAQAVHSCSSSHLYKYPTDIKVEAVAASVY